MKRMIVAFALVVGLLILGAAAVGAGQARSSKPEWTHVVKPGETLWQIARGLDPAGDPRAAVDRLIRANHLRGPGILPGQTLVLPRR